jgi:hypothetical protein
MDLTHEEPYAVPPITYAHLLCFLCSPSILSYYSIYPPAKHVPNQEPRRPSRAEINIANHAECQCKYRFSHDTKIVAPEYTSGL